MRTYFILTLLCFTSIIGFSQKLKLEKASPFTAVKWENNHPIVQFNAEWYHFEKLEDFSKKEILDFCKKQFGHKWQKRFSEDLVEVLNGLGYQPNINVSLYLNKDGISKIVTGTFTSQNRRLVLDYNNTNENLKSKSFVNQKISKEKYLSDLQQFEEILNSTSSYAQVSSFNYKSALKLLNEKITNTTKDIDIDDFTSELSKIMSEIGDRHSSIKNEAFNIGSHDTYNLKLPFGLATLDGKILALKKNIETENYNYYDTSHPYIKSIDGITIEKLTDSFNYIDKKAPTEAKLSRGSSAIQNYGALLFKNNLKCPDSVTVIFRNGENEISQKFQLSTNDNRYFSKLHTSHYSKMKMVEKGLFDVLIDTLDQNIGYINLPRMYHYEDVNGLEKFLENTLQSISTTKALIIDIRNNPGGGRAILQTFARYIIQPEQSPWIANVAYLRTDSTILGEETSMSSRYLYNYNSEELTDQDRIAIDMFNNDFKLKKNVETSKFSDPFYMVLHSGKKTYKQPVYILVNENSFSAATVFTSAFKSLPNIKIVGVTTDGSSGNSRVLHLKQSNIRVKVSTMLSFQRNGKTLDGYGTEPDNMIPADEKQVLYGFDSQLTSLIQMINDK